METMTAFWIVMAAMAIIASFGFGWLFGNSERQSTNEQVRALRENNSRLTSNALFAEERQREAEAELRVEQSKLASFKADIAKAYEKVA